MGKKCITMDPKSHILKSDYVHGWPFQNSLVLSNAIEEQQIKIWRGENIQYIEYSELKYKNIPILKKQSSLFFVDANFPVTRYINMEYMCYIDIYKNKNKKRK